MVILSWLLIPLVAAAGASVWGWIAGRPRRIALWADLDRFERMREAFSRPVHLP
ncbi:MULTISPECIES: hypothetical protein [unclassified Streptomyces]|uniref:hypothetical protein n=1 Tax=unclassified Streptomyces TaxID=2593676 RepID=UPI0036FA368E